MLNRYPLLQWLRPVLLVLAGPVLLAVILVPVFRNSRENARRSSCQSSLMQIGLGMKQYLKDYDDKFPPIVSGLPISQPRKDAMSGPNTGLADVMSSYASLCGYQCPSEMHPGSGTLYSEDKSYTDYWMNPLVAGRTLNDSHVFLIGDGDGLGNAQYAVSRLPAHWEDMPDIRVEGQWEPPWFKRHMGGANYLFIDGHVKWLLPEQVGTNDARFTP